jgi:hypothetical protein
MYIYQLKYIYIPYIMLSKAKIWILFLLFYLYYITTMELSLFLLAADSSAQIN